MHAHFLAPFLLIHPFFLFCTVTIKLQEVGFFSGGDTVGTLRLPLQRIMDAGYISGEYALDGEIGCFTPNVPGGGLPDTAEGGKVASSERGGGCGNMQGSGSGYVDPADPGSAGRNGGRSGGGRDGDDYEDRKRSKGSAVIELRWIPMFD